MDKGFGRGSLSVQVVETDGEEGAEMDLPVLAWLQKMGQTRVPPHLMLQRPHLGGFFTALQGHGRVFLGEETPLRVESMPLRLPLVLEPVGSDRVGLRIDVPAGIALANSEGDVWGYLEQRQCLLRQPRLKGLSESDRNALLGSLEKMPQRAVERSWRWFFQHAALLEDVFRLDTTALPKMPRLNAVAPRFHFAIEGSLNHLAGTLTCHYDELVVVAGEPSDDFPYAREEQPGELFDRNQRAETGAVERLEEAGFAGPNKQGQWVLKGEQSILKFYASVLPALEKTWDVRVGERFAHVTRDIQRITPEIKTVPHPDGGWLDVDIGYSSSAGDQQLPAHEIRRLLQVGQSHTRLKNGRRVAVDLAACEELDEVLRDIEPEQTHGRYCIPASQEDFLKETLGAFANLEVGVLPQAPFPEEALADLATILRDYQREGVCWMLARTGRGLSGILADEMGLGKTLQSLAVIQALHETTGEERPQSLVVCPTSLLDNWCAEAARFTPDLRVLKIHGAKRDRLWKKTDEAHVVVTSYGMLVRDLDRFRERSWLGVFLDEASAIKNSTTKNAQAACQLGGKYRFALTGTPVENSVRDIWSIMQFVAPGYLGSRKTFKERYETALANEAGAPRELQERLRRRLRPFILRRTKRRVASELPDKIEKVLTCPLTSKQRDTYTSLLRAGREKVLQARDQGEGVARMTMLTTLLRLRQVCCDLRLLGGEPEASSSSVAGQSSGKLEIARELLQEAGEGGHRVLVFSQFVGMLRLWREELETSGIDYCYLDGQTKGRQEEVDRFQNGATPVFLISLKAGGYGLNLTAADTVIHFDPWWNPAVEAQATDRAHRIGQQNVVTAYKLISEDTVEEKILRLQRRKRQVIDAALDDEQPLMQGLTAGDLEEMLEI